MNYFSSPEKQKELKSVLDSWIGTPFRHYCGVKGLGCDCVHFVVYVLIETGILVWHKNLIPTYSKDWPTHNSRELFAEELAKNAKVAKVEFDDLQNGDVILFFSGKGASHGGIYFDGYIYQALDEIGVCKIRFTDRLLQKRMRFAFRMMPK